MKIGMKNGIKLDGTFSEKRKIAESFVDKKIGFLTVISLKNYSPPNTTYNCKCDCGKRIIKPMHILKNKNKKPTCGGSVSILTEIPKCIEGQKYKKNQELNEKLDAEFFYEIINKENLWTLEEAYKLSGSGADHFKRMLDIYYPHWRGILLVKKKNSGIYKRAYDASKKYIKKCKYCKKSFKAQEQKIYCNDQCYELHRLENEYTRGRFLIFNRDSFTCIYCGCFSGSSVGPCVEFHCDHIYPRNKGGKDTADNLVTSCHKCNLQKLDFLLNYESFQKIKNEVYKRNIKNNIHQKMLIKI